MIKEFTGLSLFEWSGLILIMFISFFLASLSEPYLMKFIHFAAGLF